jgi:aspartyl-tRNA(Asn)/glutamyl-tRNA(Gln) amidotransferase subunit B
MLDEWVQQAIAAQPQAAQDFAQGKDAALGRLVGHVMKISRGQADAGVVHATFTKRLRKPPQS